MFTNSQKKKDNGYLTWLTSKRTFKEAILSSSEANLIDVIGE